MPKLLPTATFRKTMTKLRDEAHAERIWRALERFAADIHHPSLNFEKIKGSDRCSIRVTRGERIILRAAGEDAFEIIDVGEHDIYRRYR